MKYGMKLAFLFCLSSALCVSFLPCTVHAEEEETVTESETDNSNLPDSSCDVPGYHFSLDKFVTEDEIEAAKLKAANPGMRSRVTFADILLEATKYEGLPFTWGGRDPSQGGFDCVGLCMYVYNKVCGTHFDLAFTDASTMYTKNCTPVSASEARPGDLVFFKGTYGYINAIEHAGIYCGNGVMFNAGDPIRYAYVSAVKNINGQQATVLYGRVKGVNIVSSETGWKNINGHWSYFDENGDQCFGWKLINNKYYYFTPFGRMVTGWQSIADKWYYFDSNGAMQTGWILNHTYYMGSDGAMLRGWQKINGSYYHFTGSGVVEKSRWLGNYYLLEDGKMAVDQWIGNSYVDANGVWQPNAHPYEWKCVNGRYKYYCHKTKSFVTNEFREINGKKYYFDSEGYIASGFTMIGNDTYYFDKNNNVVTGWQQIDSNWYYFNASGVMLCNTWFNNFYLEADGKMATSKWIDNKYVDNNGRYTPDKWVKTNNRWWYRHQDGSYTKNDFEEIAGQTYYFDSNGYMVNGWKQIGSDWYYFGQGGIMAKDQWIGNYYFESDGKMATNKWIGNYFVGSDGIWCKDKVR